MVTLNDFVKVEIRDDCVTKNVHTLILVMHVIKLLLTFKSQNLILEIDILV